MSLTDEPDSFDPTEPQRLPTRDLLLAQALDAAIRAEREAPGSSRAVIARQPAWARPELTRLLNLAGSLDAAATNAAMSDEFREAARARLMRRIGGGTVYPAPPSAPSSQPVRLTRDTATVRRGRRIRVNSKVAWRALAVLLAALLAITATLTASANALPGDALYSVKQVSEEISWRLAVDQLNEQQQRLETLVQSAPEPAQAGPGDAIQTTQRGPLLVNEASPEDQGPVRDGTSRSIANQTADTIAVATSGPVATDPVTPTAVVNALAPSPTAAVSRAQDVAVAHGHEFDPRPSTAGANTAGADDGSANQPQADTGLAVVEPASGASAVVAGAARRASPGQGSSAAQKHGNGNVAAVPSLERGSGDEVVDSGSEPLSSEPGSAAGARGRSEAAGGSTVQAPNNTATALPMPSAAGGESGDMPARDTVAQAPASGNDEAPAAAQARGSADGTGAAKRRPLLLAPTAAATLTPANDGGESTVAAMADGDTRARDAAVADGGVDESVDGPAAARAGDATGGGPFTAGGGDGAGDGSALGGRPVDASARSGEQSAALVVAPAGVGTDHGGSGRDDAAARSAAGAQLAGTSAATRGQTQAQSQPQPTPTPQPPRRLILDASRNNNGNNGNNGNQQEPSHNGGHFNNGGSGGAPSSGN
jgi:hypothetical protein